MFEFLVLLLPLQLLLFTGLPYYYMSLTKRQIFVHGHTLDFRFKLGYGFLLWLQNYIGWVSWILPVLLIDPEIRFTQILLLDQLSRHIHRGNSKQIAHYTRLMAPILAQLTPLDYQVIYCWHRCRALAMISVAARHLCRLESRERPGSEAHRLASQLFLERKQHITQLLANPDLSMVISDAELEFLEAVNRENIANYRWHRYVAPGYQPWTEPLNYDQLNLDWLRSFEQTPVALHLRKEILAQLDRNCQDLPPSLYPKRVHYYILCSGGIDSMTLARAALAFTLTGSLRRGDYPEPIFHVLHLNWHKRNESTIEAEALAGFFAHFQSQWHLDVDFQVHEVSLDPDVADWDRLSTDYRFNLLQQIEAYHLDRVYFCMGHVVTDLIENLICNFTMEGNKTGKQTVFDPFGMQLEQTFRGVTLFRPLLLFHKPKPNPFDDDSMLTPYLKDNAVDLQIKRRNVRRLLQAHGVEYDLSRIAEIYRQSQLMRAKYHKIEVKRAYFHHPKGKAKASKPPRAYWVFVYDPEWNDVEWQEVLSHLMTSLDYPVKIKRKAIQELIKSLKRSVPLPRVINLSNPFTGVDGFYLTEDGQVGIPVMEVD